MTTNNQKQNLLPTGEIPRGITTYSKSEQDITKERINEIVKLGDAGLITAKELQLQIKNIMQEVSSKVSLFASLSHDEETTLKLAKLFKTQDKVYSLLQKERNDVGKGKIDGGNIYPINTKGFPPIGYSKQKVPYAKVA